jgi:uncharacterized membrane protein
MKQYKTEAVNKAWQQEQELVRIRHGGTREWTQEEIEQLDKYGFVSGYNGRYIDANVANNQNLATNPNNIVFAKVGEPLSKRAKQIASLRSYLLVYEKKKYFLWATMTIVIIVLMVSFKKKNIVITTPAIVTGVLGAIWLGIVSGGSIIAMFGGFAGGLIIGTVTGALTLIVLLSIGG